MSISRKTKKVLTTVLVSVLSAAILIGGAGYFITHRSKKPVDVMPVSYVSTGYWDNGASTYGTVRTGDVQTVYLDSSKLLKEVYVTEGQAVVVGDPILAYDSTMLELGLERKNISIQSDELELKLLQKELEKYINMAPWRYEDDDTQATPSPKGNFKEDYEMALPRFGVFNEETGENADPTENDDSSDTTGGESSGGESAGGESTGGESTGGESTGGESTGGESTGGESSGGESSGGESSGGESSGGESSGGESSGGESSGGESSGGESSGGESSGGESSGGESSGGESSGGESSGGESSGGESSGGESSGGESSGGESSSPEESSLPENTTGSGTKEDPYIVTLKIPAGDTSGSAYRVGSGVWNALVGKYVIFQITNSQDQVQYKVEADLTNARKLGASEVVTLEVQTRPIRDALSIVTILQQKFPVEVTIHYPLTTMAEVQNLALTSMADGAENEKVELDPEGFALLKVQDGGIYLLSSGNDLVGPPPEESEQSEESSYYDPGDYITYEELDRMVAETRQKIKEKDIALKLSKIDLSRSEKELDALTVKSEINGYVTLMGSQDNYGEPYVTISAGNSYYIVGQMSELQLETVGVGMEVTVMSWMTGEMYPATIISVSDYPLSGEYYGGGNPNASFYEFTAEIVPEPGQTINLMNGYGVNIQISPGDSMDGYNGLYLQNMYLRSSGGESYVYVRGENGLLEKRVVSTGKTLYGNYTEILDGLTQEDYVAFPYGKTVKEGAPTNIVEDMMYYY